MSQDRPEDPAPSTEVSILTDPSISLASIADAHEEMSLLESTLPWADAVEKRLSGVATWEAIAIDNAVVVEGRIVGWAGIPWGDQSAGWILSDQSRAHTVGDAVAWGRAR